jgi:hypothetical protein
MAAYPATHTPPARNNTRKPNLKLFQNNDPENELTKTTKKKKTNAKDAAVLFLATQSLIRAAARQSLFLPCPGKTQSHISSTSTLTDQIKNLHSSARLVETSWQSKNPESQALFLTGTLFQQHFLFHKPPSTIHCYKKIVLQADPGHRKRHNQKGGEKNTKKKRKKERRKSSFRNIYTLFLLAHLSGAKALTKQQRFPCFVAMEVVKLLVSERADAKREGDHCTGLDWTGLVWTGLDRTGLDWTGPDWVW